MEVINMNFRKIAAAAVSAALALALTACAQQEGSGSDEYVLKVGEVQGALCPRSTPGGDGEGLPRR